MATPSATATPTPSSVSRDDVVEHLAELARLRRPETPPWIVAQDLTFGQLRVVFWLARHGPASMSQIAQWLSVSLATVTGIVERVERHGLVARRHRDDDRRVVECDVTDAGSALVAEIDGIRLDAIRQILAVLDQTELAAFDGLLTRIIDRTRENRP